MNPMSESKFNMWRACVSIVHLDSVVTSEERKWVEEKILKLPLTIDQAAILKADLAKPLNFEEAFKKVTDKSDLAFVLNTLRVVGHLDKNFSTTEKESFNKLEKIILANLDLKAMAAEVEAIELASYHEDEVYKNNNRESIFELLFHTFMKFLNPGDYKFPKDKKK